MKNSENGIYGNEYFEINIMIKNLKQDIIKISYNLFLLNWYKKYFNKQYLWKFSLFWELRKSSLEDRKKFLEDL